MINNEGKIIRDFLVDNFDIEWDEPQERYFLANSRLNLIKKTRQGGMSFAAAAKALARAVLFGRSQNIISVKREEAQNKLSYVRAIMQMAKFNWDIRIKSDSESKIVFYTKKFGDVRIISHSASSTRGNVGDVIADEAWHYPVVKWRPIWNGINAMGIRSEIKGSVDIISSPSFADHPVEALYSRAEKAFKHLTCSLYDFPWWHFKQFCKDVNTAKMLVDGVEYARTITRQERLQKFGKDNILSQYELYIGDEEDFGVEFETMSYGMFSDFISQEMIDAISEDINFREYKFVNNLNTYDINDIMMHLSPETEQYVVGIDIGRKRDTTETAIFAVTNDNVVELRALISIKNVSHTQQFELIFGITDKLYDSRALKHIGLDYTGMGIMAGDMIVEKYGDSIAKPITFSSNTKDRMASNLKHNIVQRIIRLPVGHNRITAHLRSIQKHNQLTQMANPKPNISYTCTSKEHNGDIFWSFACALLYNASVDACGVVINKNPGIINYERSSSIFDAKFAQLSKAERNVLEKVSRI